MRAFRHHLRAIAIQRWPDRNLLIIHQRQQEIASRNIMFDELRTMCSRSRDVGALDG